MGTQKTKEKELERTLLRLERIEEIKKLARTMGETVSDRVLQEEVDLWRFASSEAGVQMPCHVIDRLNGVDRTPPKQEEKKTMAKETRKKLSASLRRRSGKVDAYALVKIQGEWDARRLSGRDFPYASVPVIVHDVLYVEREGLPELAPEDRPDLKGEMTWLNIFPGSLHLPKFSKYEDVETMCKAFNRKFQPGHPLLAHVRMHPNQDRPLDVQCMVTIDRQILEKFYDQTIPVQELDAVFESLRASGAPS